jgi:hypothetical protein
MWLEKELVQQLSKVLRKTKFNFPTSYFVLDFVHVDFVLGG